MILTKENILDWKKELDELMKDFVPTDHKYSDCNDSHWWLKNYGGQTPEDVKEDDLFYSSQN